MLELARTRGRVRVVNDEFVSPTPTNDLARQIVRLSRSDAYGLYHATSENSCSWYEFARGNIFVGGSRSQARSGSAGEFPAKAPRPQYSVLENRRTEKHWPELVCFLEGWTAAISSTVGSPLPGIWMTSHVHGSERAKTEKLTFVVSQKRLGRTMTIRNSQGLNMVKTSILVLTKNEAQNIDACLKAVYSQQGADPFEVLVVDSGSTDATRGNRKAFPGTDRTDSSRKLFTTRAPAISLPASRRARSSYSLWRMPFRFQTRGLAL